MIKRQQKCQNQCLAMRFISNFNVSHSLQRERNALWDIFKKILDTRRRREEGRHTKKEFFEKC